MKRVPTPGQTDMRSPVRSGAGALGGDPAGKPSVGGSRACTVWCPAGFMQVLIYPPVGAGHA